MTITFDRHLFRSAKYLVWKQRHTTFEPHGIIDGDLYAYDSHGYTVGNVPLDTYTPDLAAEHSPEDWAAMVANLGCVVVDPETMDDVHAAIRTWSLENLNRDDIHFQDDRQLLM